MSFDKNEQISQFEIPDPHYFPGDLDRDQQEELLSSIREIVHHAPLFHPVMPRSGKPFSVRMTNCGALGWVSDKNGYRYQDHHPVTGKPWPNIPPSLISLWKRHVSPDILPQACLINFYDADAKMGLHQDRDEEKSAFDIPVLSISLGDDCVFRYGRTVRKGGTKALTLKSGDVVILGGETRLAYHGVTKIIPGTSTLLKGNGRVNLTLRRVTAPGTPS